MNNWTDERIAAELGAIANENFDYIVILRMSQTIVPLIRQMRDELTAEIQKRDDVIRTASREIAAMQRSRKNILTGAAKTTVSLEHRYDALLDYTRRLYIAVSGMSVMELWTDELHEAYKNAPPEVRGVPLPTAGLIEAIKKDIAPGG